MDFLAAYHNSAGASCSSHQPRSIMAKAAGNSEILHVQLAELEHSGQSTAITPEIGAIRANDANCRETSETCVHFRDHPILSGHQNRVEQDEKLVGLQEWLGQFIHEEEIVIVEDEENPVDSIDNSGEPGCEITPWDIHKVPDRLKQASGPEEREDCFTPQAFAIGLHNLVNCFDASKLSLKIKIARAYSLHVYKNSANSSRWKKLVDEIVGSTKESVKRVIEVYRDFCIWTLEIKGPSSQIQVIKYWHFALLLSVDAVFLVVSLEALSSVNFCSYSSQIANLVKRNQFQIAEFHKWDLSLVENQIPLDLLRKVISLRVRTEDSGKGDGPDGNSIEKVTDEEFDKLIQRAVWQSYPFLPSDSEGNFSSDSLKCCCPLADETLHDDLEEGCNQSGRIDCTLEMEYEFYCFKQNWADIYGMSFRPAKFAHLLHCMYHVSGWFPPAPRESPGRFSFLSRSGQFDPNSGRRGSLNLRPSRLASSMDSLSREETGVPRFGTSQGRHDIIGIEDRMPSASQLREDGVRIRGTGPCLASSAFRTINLWTILSSLFCYGTFLACCFGSRCSSCVTRWRAVLELPKVRMYTETKRILRNIAIYEQLTHGRRIGQFRNYVQMMRCLVVGEEDVLLLIRSGVIQSHLAGPKEVVQSWKFMDNGLDWAPLGGPWVKIYKYLHEHRKNRWKNWYARFWIANCSNPLVACSFVIFVVLTILSALRTYLSIAQSKANGQLWWH